MAISQEQSQCDHSYGEPISGWATCLKCEHKARIKFIRDDQFAKNQNLKEEIPMTAEFKTPEGETVTIHNDNVGTDAGPELKSPKVKEPKEVVTTVLSSGAVTTGPVTTIKCEHVDKDGNVCGKERIIKVQDKFQVHFCIEHQKSALNHKRYENRKKNLAAKKAVEPKTEAVT